MSALTATLPQAIAILTNPLVTRLHDTTLLKLQGELQTSLFNHYVSTWDTTRPLTGTGRRCLSFAPDAAPPRPIHQACIAARVPWAQWAAVLVEQEFDLFVDPGCVSARFGLSQDRQILWSSTTALAHEKAAFAKLLQAEDQAMEEDVFALLDDQMRSPQWTTPVAAEFPAMLAPPRRSDSPESTYSAHSRTSSFSSLSSSTSSSGGSFSSVETIDSVSGSPSQSRRDRARQSQVFIDREKKDVTPYDGGKTTVLTGGVMLGAKSPAKPSHQRSPSSASSTWRAGRF